VCDDHPSYFYFLLAFQQQRRTEAIIIEQFNAIVTDLANKN
jgi:hypothetical protein